MKTIVVGAQRYVWCRSQAGWLMGPPAAQWLEDLQGAVAAGQDGLARHVARQLAEDCAVMLALVRRFARPLPSPSMRGAWALEQLREDPLGEECWQLIRGLEPLPPGEQLVERCRALQQGVREVVGEVPDALTPEGYYPALGLAREWLELVDLVGEEGFLPGEWTRGRDA
jgi:hypothetical protein